MAESFHCELPATSANLGPGFDALGIALDFHLNVDAVAADRFEIHATGRDAEVCAWLKDNLILETYTDILTRAGREVRPLHLTLSNEIPLGMGLGSSAAALLAGTLLANHFGELGSSKDEILYEAAKREGHPDNVAACLLGGLTASRMSEGVVVTASCGETLRWKMLLALPRTSLATEKARALLPGHYSREDAVANVQATALLTLAFALDRPELLAEAMQDRLHQPYRSEACPLLVKLLPLAGEQGVYGVALSGAGPSVLLICPAEVEFPSLQRRIREAAGDPTLEILESGIAGAARSG